jgi:hypothetical protein
MTVKEDALERLAAWWEHLPTYTYTHGLPALGTLGAALIVLERLQSDYSLDLQSHITENGTQIRGASGQAVSKILQRHGESRRFPSEGGRTSRGAPPSVGVLLTAMETLRLAEAPQPERDAVLQAMQAWLVAKVDEYFKRERVKFEFRPDENTAQGVHDILAAARSVGKEGQVAQYLVGAKLTLRFPNAEIRNDSYSTSDVQSGHPGDFLVWDIVYHVTVAPNAGHYAKCEANLRDGYRVYLIVPERILLGTRQNLDEKLARRIKVSGLEDFVAQNLDELTVDATERVTGGFRRLLETYNRRVDAVETDKSLLIELPQNLMA